MRYGAGVARLMCGNQEIPSMQQTRPQENREPNQPQMSQGAQMSQGTQKPQVSSQMPQGTQIPQGAQMSQGTQKPQATGSAFYPQPTIILREDAENQSGGGGPSNMYYTSPPSADPAASLLAFFNGGAKIKETYYPNRWAATYPDMSNNMPTNGCSISFPGDKASGWSLVYGNGTEVNVSIPAIFTPPSCNFKEVNDLVNLTSRIVDYAKKVDNLNDIMSLDTLFKSLNIRRAYQGCLGLLNSYINFQNVTATVESGKQCQFRYEDPMWLTDPCCNWEYYTPNSELPSSSVANLAKLKSLAGSLDPLRLRLSLISAVIQPKLFLCFQTLLSGLRRRQESHLIQVADGKN